MSPKIKKKTALGVEEAHTLGNALEKAMPAEENRTAAPELARGFVERMQINVVKNIRRYFDPKKMAELVASVKKYGIRSPLWVCPKFNVDRDESCLSSELNLIAGERRLRAAEEAGLNTIPVIVFDADEREVAELQAIENIQRADLTPIEEAQAFKQLIDKAGYDVKSVAEKVDKSESYVYRAIHLLDLPADGISALESGNMSVAFAHQILRAGPEQRERLVKFALTPHQWSRRLPNLDDLKDEIEKSIEKDLARAIFPKDKPYAGEEACTGCQFNSGNQGVLFEGAKKGRCTNGPCYNKKQRIAEKENLDNARARYGVTQMVGSVGSNYGDPQEIKGHPIVPADIAKKPAVKKVIEENPDAFGIGVVRPATWGGPKLPKIVLVCKKIDLIKKAIPAKDFAQLQASRLEATQNRPQQRELTPLEKESIRLMEERLPVAIAKEIAKKIHIPAQDRIAKLFMDILEEQRYSNKALAAAILGTDVKHLKDALLVADFPELFCVLVANDDLGWHDLEDEMAKKYGVDAKKIKASIAGEIEEELAKGTTPTKPQKGKKEPANVEDENPDEQED